MIWRQIEEFMKPVMPSQTVDLTERGDDHLIMYIAALTSIQLRNTMKCLLL